MATQADEAGDQALRATLQQRFEQHPQRHLHITWAQVLSRLVGRPGLLRTPAAMEATGGEPDVMKLPGWGGNQHAAPRAITHPSPKAREGTGTTASYCSRRPSAVAPGIVLLHGTGVRRLWQCERVIPDAGLLLATLQSGLEDCYRGR